MDIKDRIKLLDCEKEVTGLASELIGIPSVNPPGDMRDIAAYIRDYLTGLGLSVSWVEPEPGCVSLVSRIKGGDGPTLIFNGHMDVVPIGDRDRWSWDPFGGEIRDGYLLGRGASDMKGGLAAMLVALSKIAASGPLSGDLVFMAVPDEETGGRMGTRYLLEQEPLGDACIIGEPSGLNPTIGQKGSLWLEAVASGVPAHGSLSPLAGDNAILKMEEVVRIIYSLWETEWPLPDHARSLIDLTASILKEENQTLPVEVLGRVTTNIGLIHGGEKINIIPSRCRAEFDLRIPIGLPVEHVLKELQARIQQRFPEGVTVTPKAPPFEANYTEPDHPFVLKVLSAITEVAGVPSRPTLQWASSDARYFRYRSIPTVQYGPADLGGIHGYDERVRVASLVEAVRVYSLLAYDFLGSPRKG